MPKHLPSNFLLKYIELRRTTEQCYHQLATSYFFSFLLKYLATFCRVQKLNMTLKLTHPIELNIISTYL